MQLFALPELSVLHPVRLNPHWEQAGAQHGVGLTTLLSATGSHRRSVCRA